MLGNDSVFIFPAFDERPGNIGLQVLSVVMLGIPGAAGLMESTQPQHRFRNKLEAHLKALEVAFVGGCEELAEDTEFVLRKTDDHIGVDPGVSVVPACLAGAMKGLRGDEYLEFSG